MVSVCEESRYGSLFRRALGGCRGVSKLNCIVVRRASQVPKQQARAVARRPGPELGSLSLREAQTIPALIGQSSFLGAHRAMEALTPNKAAAQLKYGKTLKRRELSQVLSQNLFLAPFSFPPCPPCRLVSFLRRPRGGARWLSCARLHFFPKFQPESVKGRTSHGPPRAWERRPSAREEGQYKPITGLFVGPRPPLPCRSPHSLFEKA